MNKKLYVANCPFSLNDSGLEAIFAQCGTVESAKIITDRDSGRSKGFGFVEMSTNEEAERAISELNNSEHDGRAITVAEAKPQAPRSNNRFGGGGFGGSSGGRGGSSRGGRY